jgi:hypothetical protein
MVDASETARCEANYVNGSLEAVSLISETSGGVPAVAIDSLVAVVGSVLSVIL